MNSQKSYSRRSFFLIIIFMVLIAGAIAALIYYGKSALYRNMALLLTPEVTGEALIEPVAGLLDTYSIYLMLFAVGIAMIGGFILWLVLRNVAGRLFANGKTVAKGKRSATSKQREDDMQPIRNQRLYLHLLTVLQREGRLVDFFQEDLDAYADDQIGAAVRNIHANCRKILAKSLALEPIVADAEGASVTVEADFDPDSIKLTGRVTGEPPFTGTVRHKGWRVQKADLPDLTAIKDPSVIAPAEVEIE